LFLLAAFAYGKRSIFLAQNVNKFAYTWSRWRTIATRRQPEWHDGDVAGSPGTALKDYKRLAAAVAAIILLVYFAPQSTQCQVQNEWSITKWGFPVWGGGSAPSDRQS